MPRRSLVAASLAGALLVGSAGVAGATADAKANRLQGEDRYKTAVAVATETFEPGRTVALVASGHAPADAIAASYVSGVSRAPLLLTEGNRLTPATLTALEGLEVDGVILVGGSHVLSGQVHVDLETAGFAVERIAGADRYETARKLAELFPAETVGTFMAGPAAFVATGTTFADALAAGPLSAAQGMPIVLTEGTTLNDHAEAVLTSLGIEQVVLLGGVNAVSAVVEAEIAAMGIEVRRVAGATRQATAVELAEIAVGELQFPLTRVLLARGDAADFADALVGASRGGQVFAPLLLTVGVDNVGADTLGYLTENTETIANIDILGGTAAVSASAEAAAVAAARGQS